MKLFCLTICLNASIHVGFFAAGTQLDRFAGSSSSSTVAAAAQAPPEPPRLVDKTPPVDVAPPPMPPAPLSPPKPKPSLPKLKLPEPQSPVIESPPFTIADIRILEDVLDVVEIQWVNDDPPSIITPPPEESAPALPEEIFRHPTTPKPGKKGWQRLRFWK